MTVRILIGDCRVRMAELPDAYVDSVVCDPPYELGFMSKAWDSTGVANDPAMWRQVLRVLKPGGHLLAFSGTRTYHRMVVAIEDAGFEIRDQLAWIFGSGFPKSHNLPGGLGTALKPAYEPICLARKPLIGTVAANVLAHGTGALNIDGCRIEAADPVPLFDKSNKRPGNTFDVGSNRTGEVSQQGRWPANLCHDGSEEVLAGFPETSSGAIDPARHNHRNGRGVALSGSADGSLNNYLPHQIYSPDSGSAARFFYCAKAATDERGEGNNHPTVKPIALMRWLVRLVTPKGGTVLDPFMGSGSTLLAAEAEQFNAIGCEMSPEYAAIAESRLKRAGGMFAEISVCIGRAA